MHEDMFVYDVAKHKILFKSKCKVMCNNFTFSRDSKLLAINTYKTIDIYNVSNWKRVRQIKVSKFDTNYIIDFKFNKKGDEIFVFYIVGQIQSFGKYSLRKNKVIKKKIVFENSGGRI